MPRMVDLGCPECGYIWEDLKEMDYFKDIEGTGIVCPECTYSNCKELPSLVRLNLEKTHVWKTPKKPLRLADVDTPLPHEVRKLLAKELFDPCSCGDHAPADLDEHDEACHVHGHSFMRETDTSEDQNPSQKN